MNTKKRKSITLKIPASIAPEFIAFLCSSIKHPYAYEHNECTTAELAMLNAVRKLVKRHQQ